jgi:hypothetical protein
MPDVRFSRVTALLVTGPGMPEGDTRCGIEIELCLTGTGQPDLSACGTDLQWRVRRFWPDRLDWHGFLIPLGEGGWGVRGTSDPDEPLWELEGRLFRPGEYLMLRRPNGDELSFRIVSVEALFAPASIETTGP